MEKIQKYIETEGDDFEYTGRVYTPDTEAWTTFSVRLRNAQYYNASVHGGIMPVLMRPLLGDDAYDAYKIYNFLKEGGIKADVLCGGLKIGMPSADFIKMVDYLNTKWMEKHGLRKPEETMATSNPHRLAGHVQLEFE